MLHSSGWSSCNQSNHEDDGGQELHFQAEIFDRVERDGAFSLDDSESGDQVLSSLSFSSCLLKRLFLWERQTTVIQIWTWIHLPAAGAKDQWRIVRLPAI